MQIIINFFFFFNFVHLIFQNDKFIKLIQFEM